MPDSSKNRPTPSPRLAIPFLVALAVLTVVAFIIPLRPTQSYEEKRNLAEFPEFSVEALVSGDYFDHISTWFSDTFPGREGWMDLNSALSELHGYSQIAIQGDILQGDEIPVLSEQTTVTLPPETVPVETVPEDTGPTEPIVLETVEPPTTPVEQWGGVDAGEGAEIGYANSVIQIGDTLFNYCSFSQTGSDRYIRTVNKCAQSLMDKDVQIVSAPIPTSIGIMVKKEHLEKLHCAAQDEIINYMHAGTSDRVIKTDVYDILVDHNDEYLYFRTDHHWTALGAYYAYVQIMEDLGREPASLDTFEAWDQGQFAGSLGGNAAYPSKLKWDNVYAYIPQGDIEMMIYRSAEGGFSWPLLTDMSQKEVNTKYMTFLAGDHALCIVTNNSIPEGTNCVVIKDSYGNPLIPFLTQNYHKVYVIDYRKYNTMKLSRFVDEYEIDDVILLNNLNAAQNATVNDMLEWLVG